MRESRGAGEWDLEYDLVRERGEGDRRTECDRDRAGSGEGARSLAVGLLDRVRVRPLEGDRDAIVNRSFTLSGSYRRRNGFCRKASSQ